MHDTCNAYDRFQPQDATKLNVVTHGEHTPKHDENQHCTNDVQQYEQPDINALKTWSNLLAKQIHDLEQRCRPRNISTDNQTKEMQYYSTLPHDHALSTPSLPANFPVAAAQLNHIPVSGNQQYANHKKLSFKLMPYNGETSLNTWLAQFQNAATSNQWDSSAQLAHLTNSLIGKAADALLEHGDDIPQTVEELIKTLKLKFGDEGQADKFRAELKARRQRSNESLQSLHLDIQRIASKAYPGVRNDTVSLLARDAFLDAMTDQELAFKIREMDVLDIRQANKHAVRLHAIRSRRTDSSSVQTKCSTIQAPESTENNTSMRHIPDSCLSEPNSCSIVHDATTQKTHDVTLHSLMNRLLALENAVSANRGTNNAQPNNPGAANATFNRGHFT
jgi:hypothetical protein